MLSHTAGMPADRDDLPSSLYQAVAAGDRELAFAPGTRFAYSNVGYQVLGHAIEAAAGEAYPSYLRKRIFDPLGMRQSEPVVSNGMRSRVAVGYWKYADDRPRNPSQPLAPAPWVEWAAADGNVASSATDMATFLRMLLNRGAGSRGRVLSENGFRLMTSRVPGAAREQLSGERFYGYGISVRRRDAGATIGHTGGMPGYSGAILGNLDEGIGVAMLSNGPGDPMLATEFMLRCLEAGRAGQALPPLPDPPARVRNAAEYVGAFTSLEGKRLAIAAEHDGLVLRHEGEKSALERRGDDRFYAGHPALAKFLLHFGRHDGTVVEAWHGPDWYPGEGYRGPRSFVHPAEWNSFTGHYRSYNPWFSNFRIVIRKGRLYLIGPDGDESVLAPLRTALFQVGDSEGSPQLALDTMVNGAAQRANLGGADYYRTFTP